MPPKLQAELETEATRGIARLCELFMSYPEHREVIAYAWLGAGIAAADMAGADAEDFLRKLRAQHPRPAPLKPPTAH